MRYFYLFLFIYLRCINALTNQTGIYRFQEIEKLLFYTYPTTENIAEWHEIRKSIYSASELDDTNRFKNLVNTLKYIKPAFNQQEWSSIRNTCDQISRVLNKQEYQKYILDFFEQSAK